VLIFTKNEKSEGGTGDQTSPELGLEGRAEEKLQIQKIPPGV